jgi:hypothetical protein
MHTFDDWELRQLLEDTLEDAKLRYLHKRAAHRAATRLDPSRAWWEATQEAIHTALNARWHDATRPTVKE